MNASGERNDSSEHSCSIHEMTVVELSKLYGHPVSVKLLSGQFIYGNFYTVDPNTRSIILAQHFRNGEKKIVMAFGNNVYEVHAISGEELPDGCVKYTKSLCAQLLALFGISQSSIESKNELELRKRNLVKWLKENTIDVDEEADGTLVVFGSVRIQKPYTSKSCYCSVPLILNRICRLIEAMPSE